MSAEDARARSSKGPRTLSTRLTSSFDELASSDASAPRTPARASARESSKKPGAARKRPPGSLDSDGGSRTYVALLTLLTVAALCGERSCVQAKGGEEMANLDDLVLGQVASSHRAERDGLTIHSHGPVTTVRLVNFSEATEERTHIYPLDVVVERVSEQLLGGNAVVVVQLDRHLSTPFAGSKRFRPHLHFPPSRRPSQGQRRVPRVRSWEIGRKPAGHAGGNHQCPGGQGRERMSQRRN